MPQTPDDVGVNITAEQGQSSEKASANTELANLFTAAMAPFVSQMTKLNENVSLLLSGRDPASDEDGETASVEAVEDSNHKRVDMVASLSAILDSKATDKAAPRTGDAFCKSSLKISRSKSKPPHQFMKVWRAFLTGFCQKRCPMTRSRRS